MAKIGDKIKILRMEGEPRYTGREGIVEKIDDAGQIHGTWGGCAIIPETDSFEVINEAEKMTKEQAIDYLIALACCTLKDLPCEMCPLRDDECRWKNEDIVKAVKLLKGAER